MRLRCGRSSAGLPPRGVLADEIVPITIAQRKGDPIVFDTDEHGDPERRSKALPG